MPEAKEELTRKMRARTETNNGITKRDARGKGGVNSQDAS